MTTTSKTQDCRDCGKPFPYDLDADRCPECIAAEGPQPHRYPFTVRGGSGSIVASFTTLADAENYAALNPVYSVTTEAVR